MRVDPIKPMLKAPGTQRLNLKYEEVLSNVAVESNLRHYIKVKAYVGAAAGHHVSTFPAGTLRRWSLKSLRLSQ